MDKTRRKKKSKVRGFKGIFYLIASTLILMFYLFVTFAGSGLVTSLLCYVAAYILKNDDLKAPSSLFPCGGIVLILYYIIGTRWIIRNDGYYMRPIKTEEYQMYVNRNLIHYTDYLSTEDITNNKITNRIHLIANGSKKSNYAMPASSRSKKLVCVSRK